jgi:hypothetical protein
MIADIQSRIDSLSKSKKAPKNLDKAKLESAKNGLDPRRLEGVAWKPVGVRVPPSAPSQ